VAVVEELAQRADEELALFGLVAPTCRSQQAGDAGLGILQHLGKRKGGLVVGG
jgi:hypothetical protein